MTLEDELDELFVTGEVANAVEVTLLDGFDGSVVSGEVTLLDGLDAFVVTDEVSALLLVPVGVLVTDEVEEDDGSELDC